MLWEILGFVTKFVFSLQLKQEVQHSPYRLAQCWENYMLKCPNTIQHRIVLPPS